MNTKNKVALYLIIAGAVLLLLTVATTFTLKKGFIKGFEINSSELSFISFGAPEILFEDEVDILLTDTTVLIDDTVLDQATEEVDMAVTTKETADAPNTVTDKTTTTAKITTKQATIPKPQTATTKPQAAIHTTPQPIVTPETTSTSNSSPLSATNEFTIGGIRIKVEFWNPDKNFKGYHLKMSERKLLLFGIDQFSPLRFTKQDDGKLLMYYRNTPYLLEENKDIEPLQKYDL